MPSNNLKRRYSDIVWEYRNGIKQKAVQMILEYNQTHSMQFWQWLHEAVKIGEYDYELAYGLMYCYLSWTMEYTKGENNDAEINL